MDVRESGATAAGNTSVIPDFDAAELAAIVDLVRHGRATTRPELIAASRLSRRTVDQRVDQAIALGVLEAGELAPSSGGRQPRTLRFGPDTGVLLSADLGATQLTTAVLDLRGRLLGSRHRRWDLGAGPESTMQQVAAAFDDLLVETRRATPWAIAMGVPGPVDPRRGVVMRPPSMPDWDGFSPRNWLRGAFDAPVWIENDANLMALGEWSAAEALELTTRNGIFLKVGTGIGAGLIIDGRLVHGTRGAAGDVGHVHVTDDVHARCRCGKTGCLEAVASGWAVLRAVRRRVDESPYLHEIVSVHDRELDLSDIGRASQEGDPLVLSLIDQAAESIATVVGNLVNVLNPEVLAVGGGILQTGPRFVERLAELVPAVVTDVAGENLVVRPAHDAATAGVLGGAALALGHLMSPTVLSHWVSHGTPVGRGALIQDLASAA